MGQANLEGHAEACTSYSCTLHQTDNYYMYLGHRLLYHSSLVAAATIPAFPQFLVLYKCSTKY